MSNQQVQHVSLHTFVTQAFSLEEHRLIGLAELCNKSPQVAVQTLQILKEYMKGSNINASFTSLAILEFLMKNAWRTQYIVGSEEWQSRLIKLALRKSLSLNVRERIADLVQCFALTFNGRPDMPLYGQTYSYLLKRQVQFPSPDRATKPFTPPQRNGPIPAQMRKQHEMYQYQLQQQLQQQQPQQFYSPSQGRANTNQQQTQQQQQGPNRELVDLLDSTKKMAELMWQILPETNDSNLKQQEELLNDLYEQSKKNHAFIQNYIIQGGHDAETMSSLLKTNDVLIQTFEAYDSVMKGIPVQKKANIFNNSNPTSSSSNSSATNSPAVQHKNIPTLRANTNRNSFGIEDIPAHTKQNDEFADIAALRVKQQQEAQQRNQSPFPEVQMPPNSAFVTDDDLFRNANVSSFSFPLSATPTNFTGTPTQNRSRASSFGSDFGDKVSGGSPALPPMSSSPSQQSNQPPLDFSKFILSPIPQTEQNQKLEKLSEDFFGTLSITPTPTPQSQNPLPDQFTSTTSTTTTTRSTNSTPTNNTNSLFSTLFPNSAPAPVSSDNDLSFSFLDNLSVNSLPQARQTSNNPSYNPFA